MRKVFLDELPRWGKEGKGVKGTINWSESSGYIVKFIYNNIEGFVKILNYDKENERLFIEYDNKSYDINATQFSNCGLGGILGKITKDFKYKIGTSFKDYNRDLIITDREHRPKKQKPDKKGRIYVKNEKWYKYTCNKCGWIEGWIPENNLKKGVNCSCCTNRTAVLGINTIYDTHKWLVDDFGLDGEFAKTHTCETVSKGEFTCKDCRSKKRCTIAKVINNKSIGCICGDGFSYPEKFMMNVLNQLDIEFQTQYSPNYLIRMEKEKRSRKFSDFYLSEHGLIIETDGGLGHKGGTIHGYSNKTLEECIEVDKWKDEQHKLHGIETIRINCFESDMEYIKNSILNSKLNEIFDLSKIDWNQADLYAIKSNKVKEVCEYWNNRGETETTEDLIKLFELSRTTILRYLKRGHKLNLCVYNKKEERRRAVKKIKTSLGKRIEVFKNGVSVGIFNSATEVERLSLELFKTQLNHSSISATIKKKQKTHKGFTFKYI